MKLPASLSSQPHSKTPISLLTEKALGNFRFQIPTAEPTGGFRVILDFKNGQSFTGFGRNKKGCQHHAAFCALFEIFGIKTNLPTGAGPVGNPIPVVKNETTSMEMDEAGILPGAACGDSGGMIDRNYPKVPFLNFVLLTFFVNF